MPKLPIFGTGRLVRQVADLRSELVRSRQALEVLDLRLMKSFTPDGAITPIGLNIELCELDEIRRSESCDPTDAKTQTLIQGQQNECQKLLCLRKKMLDEQQMLRHTVVETEAKVSELAEKLNRRTRNA